MCDENFCVRLPEGYAEVYRLNAKSAKTGAIFTVGSVVMALAVILPCLRCTGGRIFSGDLLFDVVAIFAFALSAVAYIVLHELVHGAAYKLLTGSRLTFGVSLTVAFCGVPDIYVSRRTALTALLAPFVVFGLVFGALAGVLYFVNYTYYAVTVVLLGLHFGGCIGDLYMTGLLLFKYRERRLLLRDTGPEQFVYYPPRNE